MKDLKAIRGLRRLQELIDQGEHEHQDFKYLISDARKIARSISAFANNDGGRLLIGVKDNGTIAGVRSEEDIYMIEQAAERYCRPSVEVDFTAIKAGQGAVVFIASIPRSSERPVEVVEADGTMQAYYRVADENITAHPLMVAAWRYAATSHGTLFATTAAEGTLLEHLSHAAAADAVTRLASLGMLEFVYDGHEFLITLPDEGVM